MNKSRNIHTFLVLDLGLDVLDGVRGFNLEGNGLASKCLDENLHFVFFLFSEKQKSEI